MSDFRETLYTIDSKGKRKWVYPTEMLGFFRRARTAVAAVLLLIYLSMPWASIRGSQAILIDIVHRRFIFFGETFWATDSKFLVLILLTLGFSLFFFAALFGRVWCGWACPETVFLEFVFRPIEQLIEGNAQERRKLDASPWTLRKIRLKFLKYSVFAILSWVLASTALAYFIGREPLLAMMADYPWNNGSTFLLTLALMGVLLFQFGWFREQFCTVLCPYARFQSALMDDSSLLVGYDYNRGEPRGKAADPKAGHCVDCGLCVRVCPTGIDIRNGLQLECIQCAACADACDSIMVKINRPTGLIRYDTERGLKGSPVRFLRPRVVIYGSVLLLVLAILGFSLKTRELSEVIVLHSPRDDLFVSLSNNEVRNHFELSLSNKSDMQRNYSVIVKGDPSIKTILPVTPFPLAANTRQKVPLFITFPSTLLKDGKRSIQIVVSDDAGFEKVLDVEILG